MRLQEKVALISGGARGQGAAEAKLFASEGAKVVIGDILDQGRHVEAEIAEMGGECLFVTLDVVNEGHWQDAVEAAVRRFGKLNVLVNNAGIFKLGNVEETSSGLWDEIMDINAKGFFWALNASYPRCVKRGAAPS